MSDGVLHVLGVLLALFQNSCAACAAHLIGIEEPETALYPEAAGVLMDVLLEASERTQVIVTTHSADLLDRESIPVDSILPVVSLDRASRIGPVDDVGRSVLQDGHFHRWRAAPNRSATPGTRSRNPATYPPVLQGLILVSIMAIVEGNGEVQAVPVLLRRIAQELAPARAPVILKPIRVQRAAFVKAGVLERYVGLAAQRVGAGGSILLDANGDCPARLGPVLVARARSARSDRRIEAVVAKCEYEAGFLASVESIAGSRTLSRDLVAPPDPESIRGAKERLSQRRQTPYRPTADQAALTARFDMASARRRSPSFDKM